MFGEMEDLAQKDISTQAPGGGGESHRSGGTISWAGHSPKRKPRCGVSFAIAGFSTISFCLGAHVTAHLLCTRDLLKLPH